MDRTRRALLSAGGVAATAGLTGCLGLFGGDGGSSSEEPVDLSETYLRWLPTVEGFTGRPYQVLWYDFAGWRSHRSALPSVTNGTLDGELRRASAPLGVEPDRVESALRFRPSDTRVVTGSFEAATVADSLSAGPYAPVEGGVGDYRLYVADRADPPAVAVTDGTALLCRPAGRNTPRAVARRLLDTGGGDLSRSYGERPVLEATLTPLVDATHAAGGPVAGGDPDVERGRFEGMTAVGVAFDVGGDRTRLTYAVGFDGEVRTAAVREWATEHSDGLAAYDVSVEADGPVARVTGTAATDRVDLLRPGDP